MSEYRIIITSETHPDGVSYPGTGHPLYTKAQAIEHLRSFVSKGIHSDYEHEHGAYAESSTHRFTLQDVDEGSVTVE